MVLIKILNNKNPSPIKILLIFGKCKKKNQLSEIYFYDYCQKEFAKPKNNSATRANTNVVAKARRTSITMYEIIKNHN